MGREQNVARIVRGDDPKALEAALGLWADGELVAFATETVYGLGADATSEPAVAKIFEVKGRPANNPLIVHVTDAAMAQAWVEGWDARCDALAARFWPGPLTCVLGRPAHIPAIVAGGGDTLAVRAPAHPTAQALIAAYARPIAAPSANRSESISPTTAEHVQAELGASIQLIVDGGPCDVGVESTVIDMTTDPVRVLRAGAITPSMLSEVLETAPIHDRGVPKQPRSPGQALRHYAPNTPLSTYSNTPSGPLDRAVVLYRTAPVEAAHSRKLSNSPEIFAQQLYSMLRWADTQGADHIWIENVPTGEVWDAVRDRIARACQNP